MKAKDFEFDGRTLSSFGMVLCKFDSGGIDTIDGVKVTFNTVSTLNGLKHYATSTQYEDCLETTLQICKYSCNDDIREISSTEYRELTKWLARKKFLKLKILDEDYIDLYFEASFNINRIELNGKLYGLELEVTTNRPYALKEPKTIIIENTSKNGKYSINDVSYEEGYIYPYTEITIGNVDDLLSSQENVLTIYNALEDRVTEIKGVTSGEVITMDYPVINFTNPSHTYTDFNWTFFRIANSYYNSRNDLTISIPCTIKFKYSPIVKVGM